jgi:hypothetical protein
MLGVALRSSKLAGPFRFYINHCVPQYLNARSTRRVPPARRLPEFGSLNEGSPLSATHSTSLAQQPSRQLRNERFDALGEIRDGVLRFNVGASLRLPKVVHRAERRLEEIEVFLTIAAVEKKPRDRAIIEPLYGAGPRRRARADAAPAARRGHRGVVRPSARRAGGNLRDTPGHADCSGRRWRAPHTRP